MVDAALALESRKAGAEYRFHLPAGCATLGKKPDLSEPQLSYLQDGVGGTSTNCRGCRDKDGGASD